MVSIKLCSENIVDTETLMCMIILLFQFANDFKLTIELLDTEDQDNIDDVDASEQWSNYVEKYVNPTAVDISPEVRELMANKPIFIAR